MEDFKTIKFSTNWNRKLNNHIFTTIRKQTHYVNGGDVVAIVLNDKLYKWAQVTAMAECKFKDIGAILLMTDTGYQIEEAIGIFKNMGIDVHTGEELVKVFVLVTVEKPHKIKIEQNEKIGLLQEKIKFE